MIQQVDDFMKQVKNVHLTTFKKHQDIYSDRFLQELEIVKNIEIDIINKGFIFNEFGNVINLFQHEIDEQKKAEQERQKTSENVLIPFLKIAVDDICSYNHANDYSSYNGRKIVKRSEKYKTFRKEVFKQLESSGIKNIVNKDTSDLLKIKLYIQVKNIRKDADNLEKSIIDTLTDFLEINDNKVKAKETKVIQMKDQSAKDKFVIVIEHLSECDLMSDFLM